MSAEDQIINDIQLLIQNNAEVDDFNDLFKKLSFQKTFPSMSLQNEFFFRARKDDGNFINEISKIKYPPSQFARKGRLNDNGESIAYLSTGEVGPLLELDLGYYDIYCNARYQCINKEIIYHLVGMKENILNVSPSPGKHFEFYRNLITTKDKKIYNATISLAHILFSSQGFRSGILYNSVHEEKTNQSVFNVAIQPADFDDCFKLDHIEYNILVYLPLSDNISIEQINQGKPDINGNIDWQFSCQEMLTSVKKRTAGHIYKVNNGIVHFKYGGGLIEEEKIDSFLIKFDSQQTLVTVFKAEVKNL